MITIDELKVQLADYGKAVKDLEEALAIDASRKRVQELEHTMSRPGFYDDADLSKKCVASCAPVINLCVLVAGHWSVPGKAEGRQLHQEYGVCIPCSSERSESERTFLGK